MSLRAILNAKAEFLPTTGEVRPVQQIKIALVQFREADNAVDRAEARAEVQRTGPLLLHLHGQVLAPFHACVLRIGLDLEK